MKFHRSLLLYCVLGFVLGWLLVYAKYAFFVTPPVTHSSSSHEQENRYIVTAIRVLF